VSGWDLWNCKGEASVPTGFRISISIYCKIAKHIFIYVWEKYEEFELQVIRIRPEKYLLGYCMRMRSPSMDP
jgi:hypothetical protein